MPTKYTQRSHEFRETYGGYTPRAKQLHQIWLRSDLLAYPDLEYVAAHETRHIWQKDNDFDLFDDECRAEGDAHPFASDALKRYLAEKGCLSREIEEDIKKKREGTRAWFERCWPNGRFETIR